MYATTREKGGPARRRTKVYANNTSLQSSKASLSSVFTVESTGSADSNTTITQGSYNQSRRKKRKRPKDNHHRSNEPLAKKMSMSVDVFDFLVEGNASTASLALPIPAAGVSREEMMEKKIDHKAESMKIVGEYESPPESDKADDSDEPDEVDDLDSVSETEETNEVPAHIKANVVKPDEGDESDDGDEANEVGQLEDDMQGHHDVGVEKINGMECSDNSDMNDNESDEELPKSRIVVSSEPSELDPEGFYRSMSDSGISMGSCSMDASISSLPPRLPMLPEEPENQPTSRPATRNELAMVDPRRFWSPSPGPFREGSIPPPAPAPPQIMYDMPMYPIYPPYTPYGTPPPVPEEENQGSAIKIREPSQQDIKPQYFRSFTKVSTRIMLQLQDDIAELEGELSVIDSDLDAIEADYSSDEDGSAHPGTIRHILKARESEIYRDLQSKLAQFTSAVENMQKMDKLSQPAVLSDLTKHHRWLESRIIPSVRARHLVGNDLRRFSSQKSTVTATTVNQDTQFLAYSVLINTLLPLLIFKFVSSLLNRLILLLTIVIISLITQRRTRITIRAEDKNCIVICIGISIFAAIFL